MDSPWCQEAILRVRIWVAAGLLAIAAAAGGSEASQSFSPTLSVSLTDSNPSASSNVVTSTRLAPGSHALGNFSLNLPAGWSVAGDTDVPFGDIVAEATISVDVDCDSSLENFGFLLTNAPADPAGVAEWNGQITSWWSMVMTVEGDFSQGYDISADLTNFSVFHALCAPQTLALTIYGRSVPANAMVVANPSSAGAVTFTAPLVSLGAEHTSQASAAVCICITPDQDLDGVIDETPCGSSATDSSRRPERIDGPFVGVDDDGDGQVDEGLPPGALSYDCDGDGYIGSAENNVYAPNTRGDQDACGSDSSPHQSPATPIGWPGDVKGGSFSGDRLDVADLASYITPVRRLNKSPGDAGFDVRWDIVPGSTFGKVINLQDLASISALIPPMLGSVRAFSGPLCRWPTTDLDGDGVIDEASCGGNSTNASRRPERIDGAFAGVDDDGDTLVDEMLPPNVGIYDCDGDGYESSTENHVFAPAIRGDQDPCGNSGWPADLVGGAFSANKVDVVDLANFVTPVRHLNTSPGDAAYAPRWDLVPGTTFGKVINVQDLASLTSLLPPMLANARAFNGPPCPWSP